MVQNQSNDIFVKRRIGLLKAVQEFVAQICALLLWLVGFADALQISFDRSITTTCFAKELVHHSKLGGNCKNLPSDFRAVVHEGSHGGYDIFDLQEFHKLIKKVEI